MMSTQTQTQTHCSFADMVKFTEHVIITNKPPPQPTTSIPPKLLRIILTDADATDSSSDEEHHRPSPTRTRRRLNSNTTLTDASVDRFDSSSSPCSSLSSPASDSSLSSPTSVLRYEETFTPFDSLGYVEDMDAFGFQIDVPSYSADLSLSDSLFAQEDEFSDFNVDDFLVGD
ncbi:hypothetical protein CCACVL1_11612 [Corchorus capsularis]|uniref:Uncharacterized protein n=1 Tax=Corchorus capsularis TaxID=210143 RepID=A0A1R3IK76_COCAP|nr:hypothetical protein CCACVL1_11612 [Corchorus capsularis]